MLLKIKVVNDPCTVGSKKERHIYFPSHLDSIIYSYYNHLLTIAYEKYLEEKPYGSVAVAYRKIPIGDGEEVATNAI